MQTRRFRGAASLKAVILLMFIVAAVVMVRFTGVREFLTVEKFGALPVKGQKYEREKQGVASCFSPPGPLPFL